MVFLLLLVVVIHSYHTELRLDSVSVCVGFFFFGFVGWSVLDRMLFCRDKVYQTNSEIITERNDLNE